MRRMAGWQRVALVAVLFLGGLLAANIASVAMAAFLYVLTPAEEIDASTQPIEVIVTEADRTCGFNVEAVAPGRHDVHVIANDADSEVVIREPSGEVVLRETSDAASSVSEARTVRLRPGTYDVTCRTSSVTMTAELPVVPAGELG